MTANSKQVFSTRKIAGVGMLSAAAAVLMLVEFPIPIMPGFIKFDLSDLPALIGAFAYGPVAGILVELLKNLMHGLFLPGTKTSFIGELSNFLLGGTFAGIAGFIYQRRKNKVNALIGSLAGSLAMGLICIPSNYFVVYPFYYNFMPEEAVLGAYQAINPSMQSILQCLVVFNFPFTAVKGLACAVITFLVYKRLSPILKGNQ